MANKRYEIGDYVISDCYKAHVDYHPWYGTCSLDKDGTPWYWIGNKRVPAPWFTFVEGKPGPAFKTREEALDHQREKGFIFDRHLKVFG